MPEFLYATSHLAGDFTNPANAVGNTPGTWAGALNENTSRTSRWALGDPVDSLTAAAVQSVRVVARKGSNSNNPTVALNLYEGGVLVGEILAATAVSSQSGQTLTATFNTSQVSDRAAVEIEVVMTAAGGSPNARNSAQISHIEWEAATSVAAPDPAEGAGSISGGGSLEGVGFAAALGSGTVSAGGDLSGVGYAAAEGSGFITDGGSLIGVGSAPVVGSAAGAGAISGGGSVAGVGHVATSGSGSISGSGNLSGDGSAPAVPGAGGSGSISGAGLVVGGGYTVTSGSGELLGGGALKGSGSTYRGGAGRISAAGRLLGAGPSSGGSGKGPSVCTRDFLGRPLRNPQPGVSVPVLDFLGREIASPTTDFLGRELLTT